MPANPYAPPSLYVEGISGPVLAFRNAFTWPRSPQEMRQVERKEMPPRPVCMVATAPGESLKFSLKGHSKEPQSIILELVNPIVFSDPGAWDPIYSTTIDPPTMTKAGITFNWTVPVEGIELPGVPHRDKDEYCLKVDVRWGGGSGSPTGWPLHVEYIARLLIAEKSLIERAIQIPVDVSQAAWDGDQAAIEHVLSSAWFDGGVKRIERTGNPFDVRLDDPWDVLLWRDDELRFSLASKPEVYLEDFWGGQSEPVATVNVTYKVRVTDKAGKSGIWDFRERYGLHLGDAARPVDFMDRHGEPGFGDSTAAEWTPKVSHEGQVMKVGPFHDVSWPYGTWSDDGKCMAFVANDRTEDVAIWAVSRDGAELKRLYSPNKPEVPVSPSYVRLLGWAPGEHKLRFYVSGYQPGPGPHEEDCGLWLCEVDVSTGETRSIAFIKSQRWRAWSTHVTEDRSHVILRDPDDLWRVNLSSGETVKLAENIRPPGYDLFNPRFSPSGWHAAYLAWEHDRYSLVVYDMKTGARTDIPLPGSYWDPAGPRPFFQSWTPDGLLAVALAAKEDIGEGPDYGYPFGLQKIQFYSPDGTLRREVEHRGAKIGSWAWTKTADKLAYTIVTVSKTDQPNRSHQWEADCELKEVWVLDAHGTAPYKIASVSGQPNAIFLSMDWVDNDRAVEMWFYPDYVNRAEDRRGLRVGLDGHVTQLSEPGNREGVARPCGAIGETKYYVVNDLDDARVFAIDAEGNETVIYNGPAQPQTELAEPGLFVVVAIESESGIFGRHGYIYLHQP